MYISTIFYLLFYSQSVKKARALTDFTYSILKYKYNEKSLQTSNTTIQIDVFGADAASVIETT